MNVLMIGLLVMSSAIAGEVCSVKQAPYESMDYLVECTAKLENEEEVKKSSSEVEMIKLMTLNGYDLKAQLLRPYWTSGTLNKAVGVWTFIKN